MSERTEHQEVEADAERVRGEQSDPSSTRVASPRLSSAGQPARTPSAVLGLQALAGNAAVAAALQAQRSEVEPEAPRGTEGSSSDVIPPNGEEVPDDDHAQGLVIPPAEEEEEAPGTADESGPGTAAVVAPPRPASPWAAAEAPARPAVDWGSQAEAIAAPSPVASLGAITHAAAAGDAVGTQAIVAASSTPLATIQSQGGGNAWRLGWTSFPLATAKAPNFDFKSTNKAAAGKPPEWWCEPTLTQAAYEGDNVCMFLPAGTHKTQHQEGGKDVYWVMDATMSGLDSDAENEHGSDTKLARDISIAEADTVLTTHIVGKAFGPKPTQAEAETMVLDTITAKLTHAGLGNDKTKWAGIYETLYRKTLQRDDNSWHSFALGNRRTNPAGDVLYDVQAGSTSINKTASNAIIKY